MKKFIETLRTIFTPKVLLGMGVNDVPGTPNSLSDMGVTGIRKIAWDSKLKTDSVRPSVLTQIKTEFEISDINEIIITKPGLVLDVTNTGRAQQGQSVRCSLRTPLKYRAQYGTGEKMLGNEDESDLYFVELYYNEIKKAVKMNKWGYDSNDYEYLDFNAGYGKQLSDFHAENDDSRMHQALLLTYGPELTYAPLGSGSGLSQQFNKNWCIPNLAESSYPAYDVDALTITDGSADTDNYYSSRTYSGLGTFVENIAAALLSASGTGSTSNAVLNIDNMVQVVNYIQDAHVVEPIMVDGVPSYIWLIPTPVKNWMMNPNNTGSLHAYFQNVAEYKDPSRTSFIGEMGRFMECMILVHDKRYSTLVVSGEVGSYTLTPGFLQPGNNDDRNRSAWSNTSGSTNYAFDISMVLGMNALAKYTRDDMVANLAETTEYGQIEGKGTYKGEGIQIPRYDKDSASQSASTQIQRGSCIVPVSRRSVNTLV